MPPQPACDPQQPDPSTAARPDIHRRADVPLYAKLEEIAARFPERPAVADLAQRLTYASLHERADQVARAIIAQLEPEVAGKAADAEPSSEPRMVGLLFDLDVTSVVALLGVLKAGHAYVALDAAHPRARLRRIVEHSSAAILLTDQRHLAAAQALAGPRVAVINVDKLPLQPTATVQPLAGADPAAPATLIYTSGSTGDPKGITHSQRNVVYGALSFGDMAQMSPQDRLACFSSLSTITTFRTVFGPLLHGGCACLYDVRRHGAHGIPRWLRAEEITIAIGRAVMLNLVRTAPAQQFPALRMLFFGGDALYRRDIEACQAFFPAATLLTSFACSEAGQVTSYWVDLHGPIEDAVIPCGFADEGYQLSILDDAGQPVQGDGVGEIAVQSRYLGGGYWRDPERTFARYLEDPAGSDRRIYLTGDLGKIRPDGCLIHLGRQDFLVKIQGNQVNIAEVEAELLAMTGVREVAVTSRQNSIGHQYLVAHLAPVSATHRPGDIYHQLAQTLPDYMIPARFIFSDALPRNANGKIDRLALPNPDRDRPDLRTPYAPPATPLEVQLASIWQEVLELDLVGRDDSFLELGGHSLLATQVLSRVNDALQVDLSQEYLLRAGTVAQMALAILEQLALAAEDESLEQLLRPQSRPAP